jgi:RNA polymerase sigma factor (sigma-70 family)
MATGQTLQEVIALAKEQEGLIAQAAAGDTDSLGEMYQGYGGFIRYYCKRFLDNKDEVESAHSEVVLRMVHKITSLRDPERFVGWLYTLTHNTCVDINRRESHARKMMLPIDTMQMIDFPDERVDSNPLSSLENKDLEMVILQAMEALPKRQREVAEKYYIQQLTYEEISEQMSISDGSIAQHLSRARVSLRKSIEKKGYAYSTARAGFVGYFMTELERGDLLGKVATASSQSGIGLSAKVAAVSCVILLSGAAMYFVLGGLPNVDENNLAPRSAVEEAAAVEAGDVDIVFVAESDANGENAGNIPARYDPKEATLSNSEWTPVEYKVTLAPYDAGADFADSTPISPATAENAEQSNENQEAVVAYGKNPTSVINIAEMNLAPGEYLITWWLESGKDTIVLKRTFQIR